MTRRGDDLRGGTVEEDGRRRHRRRSWALAAPWRKVVAGGTVEEGGRRRHRGGRWSPAAPWRKVGAGDTVEESGGRRNHGAGTTEPVQRAAELQEAGPPSRCHGAGAAELVQWSVKPRRWSRRVAEPGSHRRRDGRPR